MTNDTNAPVFVTSGYSRDRHWEHTYHDLHDLYGPMIGIEGPTMWFVYKRHIQRNPDHLLLDLAWPSHKELSKFYTVGETKLRGVRQRLEKAGLITVTRGRDLAAQSQWNYDRQLLNGGKIQNSPITLAGPPIKLTGTPSTIYRRPPNIGEHSEEILAEAGITSARKDRP